VRYLHADAPGGLNAVQPLVIGDVNLASVDYDNSHELHSQD
jgi:hypothetical protein